MTPPGDSSAIFMTYSSLFLLFFALDYNGASIFPFLSELACKRDFWITTSSVAKKGVGDYSAGGHRAALADFWPRPQGALTPLQGCSKRSRTDAADEECLACFA